MTLRVKAGFGHHTYNLTHHLITDSKHGPKAGDGDYHADFDLDLDKIKYEVQDFKKKKGEQKKLSPEDRFMMAGVQPATHGKFVTNEYFLVAQT